MKRNLLLKLVSVILFIAGIIIVSCEKNPTEIDSRESSNSGKISLGRIGIVVDDVSNTFKLFIGEDEVNLNNGLGKVNANVNNQVTLTDVDYTPLGCNNYPAVKTRTMNITFTKVSNGSSLSNVYANLASSSNLDAIHAALDNGDNNIVDGESFTLEYTLILSSCAVFSLYFDLEGTVN